MRLKITREGTFIPKFNNNKKQPATDQITVRYRTPTVEIKNRCRTKPQTKGIASTEGKIDHMEVIVEKDDIATLREMLISISGCSFEDNDGNETVISGAQDLISAPIEFEPLLKEIVAEFDRLLDRQEISKKN